MSSDDEKGYKVKIKRNSHISTLKRPLYCPKDECRQITSNLDDPYLEEMGICKNCYVLYVEDRKVPAIDVDFYRKRLKERGY